MTEGHANKVRLTADNWLGLAGLVCTIVGGFYFILDKRFSHVEQLLQDHEIRLTKREANAFTVQQANDLSHNVSRLTLELSQHEKIIEFYRSEAKELSMKIDEIKNSLRTTPDEVRETVIQNQKMIQEILRSLGKP